MNFLFFSSHFLQFDWAGCAVATLRREGACASSAVSGDGPFQDLLPHTDLALDHLDEILMFYAMKAMELPPVPDLRPATPGKWFRHVHHVTDIILHHYVSAF